MTLPSPSPDSLDDDQLLALAARAAALPDAPAAHIQAAIGLWSRRPGAWWRRVQAVLRLDSAVTAPLALGVRTAGDVRHLLFSAEGRDIDLRIQAATTGGAAGFTLQGQVLGPDEAGTLVLRATPEGDERQAALDDLGGFRIDGVPAGHYLLSLQLGRDLIELPPLAVGQQPP